MEILFSNNGIGPAAIYPAAVVATTNEDNFNFPNSLYAFMYCIIPGAVLLPVLLQLCDCF